MVGGGSYVSHCVKKSSYLASSVLQYDGTDAVLFSNFSKTKLSHAHFVNLCYAWVGVLEA